LERNTAGFTLTPADQQTLANGERVQKSNGGGDQISIRLIANFPNFFPEPSPEVPGNVRGSNPFDLVVVESRHDNDHDNDRHDRDDHRTPDRIYVSDGGRNLVWKVNPESGAFSILAVFPQVANPLFGPPFIDAVPTGIAYSHGRLLVTLFRGFPFPPGTSVVAEVSLLTGNPTPLISGLKSAIDVLPLRSRHDIDHLVLQHASVGPFFDSPGLLLRFETPAGPPDVVANCLTLPTSMTLDRRNGTIYVTELTPMPPGVPVVSGRIVSVPLVP
jgi:hypothetical protein